jgi:hypothetical protein
MLGRGVIYAESTSERRIPMAGKTQESHCKILHVCALVILMTALASTRSAVAQAKSLAELALPNAPSPQTQASLNTTEGSASISGTVTDAQGALIAGAHIELDDAATHEKREAISDSSGQFAFSSVEDGLFSLTIEAAGFAPAVRTGIIVRVGQGYLLTPTIMEIAPTASTVQVTPKTQYELAQAQLKAQEKQRFLFIVPNLFVSYVPDPVPLTAKQKISLAARATLDLYHLIDSGAVAGWQQARNDYPGYGQGASGYAKRFGAAYGNTISGTFIGEGLVPAMLHQDARYFYKGTRSVPSRIGYALLAIVRTKGDNGRWEPNYSSFVGGLASGAISNSYLPAGDRKPFSNVLNGALQHFAARGIGTLTDEFLSRWVTTHARDKGTVGHNTQDISQ